ncbi:hypothetical protein K438DRAFT_2016065 [Mycena galopus ATCC 62051]|nr:hypothetical protein K438DRAFT_2016065 [Mycena galopus ATCC 62051]
MARPKIMEEQEAVHYPGPPEEAGSSKLWAVYVSEAEKYDKSLVESWKGDMEGLLIFAALFSSILTAFLIESYGSLNANSGDLTVLLLAQISHQLAASANGTTFDIPPFPPSFRASSASLVCNGLWFISLGLSLACALIATFVQQWARDFLHKADIRSGPIIRARIFSYLYYGLKRFQMHTVVEIIPLLLHASLSLFFCGLVAFLVPVNLVMAIITTTVLTIFVVVYCSLTLLPLCYLDCPYQTPLTGLFWRGFQYLQISWVAWLSEANGKEKLKTSVVESRHKPCNETMVEAMACTAMEVSDKRTERDYKALVWTVKSLTDNVGLEPFVEAIPPLLWGPNHRRKTYDAHIRGLVHAPEIRLLDRIVGLLKNSYTGVLSVDANQRRIISSCKAFWAVASLSDSTRASGLVNAPPLDLSRILHPVVHAPQAPYSGISLYSVPAATMILWSMFHAFKSDLLDFREYLVSCEENKDDYTVNYAVNYLKGICDRFSTVAVAPIPCSPSIMSLRSLTEAYLSEIPHRIMVNFLSHSVDFESPPYHWQETWTTIWVSSSPPPSLKALIEETVDHTILSQMGRLNANETLHNWTEGSILGLLSLWEPSENCRIPRSIIELLNQRPSLLYPREMNHPFSKSTEDFKIRLWECFRTAMSSSFNMQQNTFTAIWHLISLYLPGPSPWYPFEMVLTAISMAESHFPIITCSVTALLKVRVLLQLQSHIFCTMEDFLSLLNHHLCPAESGMPLAEEFRLMHGEDEIPSAQAAPLRDLLSHRLVEARLQIVAEYLEHCTSNVLPYNTVETLARIKNNLLLQPDKTAPLGNEKHLVPQAAVHSTHQLRLANSIYHVIHTANPESMDLLDEIINWPTWDRYTSKENEEQLRAHREGRKFMLEGDFNPYDEWSPLVEDFWPWLDDPIGRKTIQHAFTDYKKTLMSTTDGSSRSILSRLEQILRGINFWHS